jgi:signal transduction histidine kinase
MAHDNYSLQRRLAVRLGALFLAASAILTAGLFFSAYRTLDLSAATALGANPAVREEFVHLLLVEYFRDVVVLALPFIVLVLLVGYFTLAGPLRLVSALSRQAAAVEPPAAGVRLPTEGVPSEVLPLIAAVNDALNRLEGGFVMQRQFLANAAHQLRTPLAALIARIDDLPAANGAADTTTALQGDVRRLNRLVNQLLKIAQFSSLTFAMTAVDLCAIAQETVAFLAPLAIRRGRTISLVVPASPVVVQGNHGAIGDALVNIVENAMEHSPYGGDVEVVVEADGVLSVLDRGAGVAEQDRPHVFERFWRGPNSRYDGAGLGLAIVAEVAQQHGAVVTLDKRAGGGTVATLRFPLPNRASAA